MLGQRADPNLRCRSGNTALYYAARHGLAPLVAELLAAGADPDLLYDGKTALEVAVRTPCGAPRGPGLSRSRRSAATWSRSR